MDRHITPLRPFRIMTHDRTSSTRRRARLPPLDRAQPPAAALETATFALGCFWEPDACFGALDGVARTRVGYTGGGAPSPRYESIGDHIEAVQIDFDPTQTSYEELLEVFWSSHSPEFRAFRRQYMSAIFPCDDAQAQLAEASLREKRRQRRWRLFSRKVYTEILEPGPFWPAEPYHQKYRLRQERPLMREFDRVFAGDAASFADSTAAARANAYVAGHRRDLALLDQLGLTRRGRSYLLRLIERGRRA